MVLPAIAAIGGMATPALVYILININNPENMSGWAIPTATDIAFSLAVLLIIGKSVPLSPVSYTHLTLPTKRIV